jgi:hypothetical protein
MKLRPNLATLLTGIQYDSIDQASERIGRFYADGGIVQGILQSLHLLPIHRGQLRVQSGRTLRLCHPLKIGLTRFQGKQAVPRASGAYTTLDGFDDRCNPAVNVR